MPPVKYLGHATGALGAVMNKVVLVTFAGRERRMEILTRYVQRAMDEGQIDEWHVWDFTRSPEDHAWVTRTFGPARFMGSLVPYEAQGNVTASEPFRSRARIEHDLHIALVPNDGSNECFEIVVGGWNNSHSAARRISRAELETFDRPDESRFWMRETPAILSPGQPNDITVTIDDGGVPTVAVNDVTIGRWPQINLRAGASVMLRGGWGATIELCDIDDRVRRYVGNPNERMPYWQAYDYYARRSENFADTVFLKCDDDIVYLDPAKLGDFIEFRKANPKYFIVSANVVNNGVCAYWQQQSGAIPASLGDFERPPGGFGGTLWLSAERATQLHDFFLDSAARNLPLTMPVIDWTERQSINFIAWLGSDLKHMALPKCDDELALSVTLPALVERPSAIYSDFTVSHLSFGPQEQGLEVDRLLTRYDALMRETLAQ